MKSLERLIGHSIALQNYKARSRLRARYKICSVLDSHWPGFVRI